MRMLFLILGCSSVTLGDSDEPPCLSACDLLYVDCVEAGVVYAADHADCVAACQDREDAEPGGSTVWGECVLAGADGDAHSCQVAGIDCGVTPCLDPSASNGQGGCGQD